MAIIDDILNRNKSKSFYPVDEQDLAEVATNMPDIPVTQASDQDNKQPAEIVQAQQDVTPVSGNKWGYSQEEMGALAKAGYTPDKLEYFLSDFDPAKGESYLQRIYEASATKPKAPDEKQIKRAKLIGSIGDSLGLLAQMWSSGKGAHVKERDYKNSASAQIADDERSLRTIYKQQQNKYDDGLHGAMLKDLIQSLNDYNNGKKGISGIIAAERKLNEAARQADAKMQFNYDKTTLDQANKDREFELKKKNQEGMDRHRKALEAQGWSRVSDSKNRTTAYVKRATSSAGTKSNNYQMVFAANPNDEQAVEDNQLGTKVRMFEMSKGEIDRYAREALADKEFMDRHQDLIIQRPDMLGSGSYRYKPNADIAAAYLKEQYEKGNVQSSGPPSENNYNGGNETPVAEDEDWTWID